MLPEQLTDPVLIAIVTLVIAALLHYQKGLTYSEYRGMQRVKTRVFVVLDRVEPYGYGHFIHEKPGREDDEFLETYDGTLRDVWRRLQALDGSPHLISSVKKRPAKVGSAYSDLHFVWSHEDGSQSEVYCFANDDGTVDVYAHLETGVRDVEGHLEDGIAAGDPRGVVWGKL